MRQPTIETRTERLLRRGSALILVIGALALISVFAAIYLSIGRADRQNAAALKQRIEFNEFKDYFGEYIAGVIGDDRMDVYPVRSLNPRDREYHRESIDYPYTDWSVRSQPDFEAERFYPSGRHLAFLTGGNDPRVPYDPWLASTQPEYLGSDNYTRGFRSGGTRYYSQTFGFGGDQLTMGTQFLDNRDWRQISNLAPDGRFVNLWNLRPSRDERTDTFGGFDARPGFGTYDVDGRERRSMSYALSLLNRNGNGDSSATRLAGPFLQSFDPTENGRAWIAGYDAPQPVAQALGISPAEIVNVPAVWTMNQRYLFSPANQPFYTYDRYNEVADWSSPDFLPYQYADADGDGLYDSRWFELIDASDENAFKNLLPIPTDDVRLFAAARVEDLSARVNVNAAGDQLIAPSREYPVGLTPAEIDLRRLLTTEDFALETGVSFNQLDALPGGADNVQNYQEYDYFTDQITRSGIDARRLLLARNSPVEFTNEIARNVRNVSVAEEVGRLAYDAIRVTIANGRPPADDAFGPRRSQDPGGGFIGQDLLPNDLITSSRFAWTPISSDDQPSEFGRWEINNLFEPAQRRALYYDDFGGRAPISQRDKLSPLGNWDGSQYLENTGRIFGLDDLTELLTYRGVNDPRVTTRLEQAVTGRADVEINAAGLPPQYPLRQTSRRFSPLLSNRPLEVDRFGHGDGRLRRLSNDSLFRIPTGPRVGGDVDEDAMVLLNASPRLYLTTLSGMTPMPTGSTINIDQNTLLIPALDEQKLTIPIKNVIGSVQTSFRAYARTLLRESNIQNFRAWRGDLGELDRAAGSYDPLPEDTTFYGHRGPELALRLSAHLAVNLSDMMDEDDTPSAATLIADRDAVNDLLDPGNYAGLSATAEHPFGWMFNSTGEWVRRGGPLDGELRRGLDYGTIPDPDSSNPNDRIDRLPPTLPDANTDEVRQRRAVNVYGVEPNPVLTEVAVLNVFTDAPEGAGGDEDSIDQLIWDPQVGLISEAPEPEGGPSAGGPGQNEFLYVTIDPEVPDNNYDDNPDFLFQALVFQVHNPTAETITFQGNIPPAEGQSATDANIRFSHYLEYAGRFFRLGQYSESRPDPDAPPTTPAAEVIFSIIERYQSVSIPAGETAVFYALMNEGNVSSFADFDWAPIEQRVKDILATSDAGNRNVDFYGVPALANTPANGGEDQNQFTGITQEWFERNLRDNGPINTQYGNTDVSVYRIREFSPATGKIRNSIPAPNTIRNLTSNNTVAVTDRNGQGAIDVSTRASNEVVRLWRVMRDFDENRQVGSGPNATLVDNIIANDLLVDRLSVFQNGENQLTKELDIRDGGIVNTLSLSMDLYDPYNDARANIRGAPASVSITRNDNTGWTVAQWAGVRRAGREFDGFEDPENPDELIRGGVTPAMIASQVFEDEMDPRRGTNRRRANRWTTDFASIGDISQLNDLINPANQNFEMIDAPNFKYRLIDLLDMNLSGVNPTTGLVVGPFNVADAVSYGDTANGPVLPGMALAPQAKAEGLADLAGSIDYYEGVTINAQTFELDNPVVKSSPAAPDDEFDLDYDDNSSNPNRVNPDVPFGLQNSNDEQRYTIRPTDLLLPFAVGPVHVPQDPGGTSRANDNQNFDPDAEWITFPEMLAIALGYTDVSADSSNTAINQLYGLLWTRDPGNRWSSVLHAGKLRLDAYPAFYDLDLARTEGDSTSPRYPGNFTPGVDKIRGSGVPLALEIPGEVRGVGRDMREIGYRPGVSDPPPGLGIATPDYAYNERFDARTDLAVGKININTAPEAVLRLLPGLSPSVEYYDPARDDGMASPGIPRVSGDWAVGTDPMPFNEDGLTYTDFGTPQPDPFVLDGQLDSVRDTPDRAALLTAYRDKRRAWPRNFSDPVTVTWSNDPANFARGIDFTPFTPNSPHPWRNLATFTTSTPTPVPTIGNLLSSNFQFDRTRQIITGINGLRETPGFATVGEVLAVTVRPFDAPETPDNGTIPREGRDPANPDVPVNDALYDFNRHNLMTGMGADGSRLKADLPYYNTGGGLDKRASYDPSIYSDGDNDSVIDEQDERIAAAAAITNMIDVRSDTYAVWFVLQAYRPEDVADLRPEDPLVPTFQRRYLMVIDRSNVVSENDEPKILVFTEVPL
ncbi:MAG: hypothetical protein ACF8Q5_00220 [Phycisphaerales bacterium JB040]